MESKRAAIKVVELKRQYLNASEMVEQYLKNGERGRASISRISAEIALEQLLRAIDELEGSIAGVSCIRHDRDHHGQCANCCDVVAP